MVQLEELIGKDFIESTLNDLRKEGHSMNHLKVALKCTNLIFNYIEDKTIEHFLTESAVHNSKLTPKEQWFFSDCAQYVSNKLNSFPIPQFGKLQSYGDEFELFPNPKIKHSPYQTFFIVFTICFEQKKKLNK